MNETYEIKFYASFSFFVQLGKLSEDYFWFHIIHLVTMHGRYGKITIHLSLALSMYGSITVEGIRHCQNLIPVPLTSQCSRFEPCWWQYFEQNLFQCWIWLDLLVRKLSVACEWSFLLLVTPTCAYIADIMLNKPLNKSVPHQ